MTGSNSQYLHNTLGQTWYLQFHVFL